MDRGTKRQFDTASNGETLATHLAISNGNFAQDERCPRRITWSGEGDGEE